MRDVPESCVGAYVTTLTSELIPVSPRFVELLKKTRRARDVLGGLVARGSLRQHLCVVADSRLRRAASNRSADSRESHRATTRRKRPGAGMSLQGW